MLGEFEQIEKIMAPLAEKAEGAFALKNDGAVFSHGTGEEIVVTTDTLIADVHFFADDDPHDIAHKLLAVNLSDLASMGATPAYYTLNTSYPKNIDSNWIKRFADGLAHMQERFGIYLLGGDTTATPGPLSLSLSAFGTIVKGMSLPRLGARVGDLIYVSGTIGDAALGLRVAQGNLKDFDGFLHSRYLRPEPRVQLGQDLIGLARCCLDISDGLIGDLGHMRASADIFIENIPLSSAAKKCLEKDSSLLSSIVNGGDDYELLFCIDPIHQNKLTEIAQKYDYPITNIGRITDHSEIRLLDKNGLQITEIQTAYRHF